MLEFQVWRPLSRWRSVEEIMATRAWTTAASALIHSVVLWEARTASTRLLTWNQSVKE